MQRAIVLVFLEAFFLVLLPCTCLTRVACASAADPADFTKESSPQTLRVRVRRLRAVRELVQRFGVDRARSDQPLIPRRAEKGKGIGATGSCKTRLVLPSTMLYAALGGVPGLSRFEGNWVSKLMRRYMTP